VIKISKAALLAAVLSLSAVPVAGTLVATAQETTAPETTTPGTPTTPKTELTTTLSIPVITAIGSSMDEAALRDALSGGFLKHVNELAALNATSINIPEIVFTITSRADGASVEQVMRYKDIVLTDVRNGVAGSAQIGSASTTTPEGSFDLGRMSAAAIDVRAILEFYSFVEAGTADAPMRTFYRDFVFEGGNFSGPEASCRIGRTTADSFDARPLKVSFGEMLAAAEALEAGGDTPSPEAVATFVGFLADLFTAFRSTPVDMDGLACTGKAEDGEPFEFSIGGLHMDGYAPGYYPAFGLSALTVAGGTGADAGTVSLDAATIKTIDLRPTLAALDAAATELSPAWLERNWRTLVPGFGGLALSGLDIDVPDPETPGKRVVARVGDFDLSLSDYRNGVPARVSTSGSGIVVPLPQDSTDPQLTMLLAAGLESVDLGFDVSGAWDEAAKTITLDKVALRGVDLGGVSIGAVLGNATEQLFSTDPTVALASGLVLTVKSISIEMTDAGFGAIAWPLAAAQEGETDVMAFRTKQAGLVEGLPTQLFGSTDAARQLGRALGDFITGRAAGLRITFDATDPDGVALPLLMAAQKDPTVLNGQFDVTGAAQ